MNALDRTLHDNSSIAAILDMIARRAPVLMRSAGGSLPQDQKPTTRRGLTREQKANITRKYHKGKTSALIAQELELTKSTVWRYVQKLKANENDGNRIVKIVPERIESVSGSKHANKGTAATRPKQTQRTGDADAV